MIEKGIRRKYNDCNYTINFFSSISKPCFIPYTHAHSQIDSPQLRLLVADGKNEKAMPLAKAAKRVRRSARGVEVDFVDSGALSLVGERREGGAAGCSEPVEVEEMLTGEGGGGEGGCVRRL